MQDSDSNSWRLHIITASILAIIGNKRCWFVLIFTFSFEKWLNWKKNWGEFCRKVSKPVLFSCFIFCVGPATLRFWHRKRFLSPFHSHDCIKHAKEMQYTQGHFTNETNNPNAVFFHFFLIFTLATFQNNSEALVSIWSFIIAIIEKKKKKNHKINLLHINVENDTVIFTILRKL